MAPSEWSRFSSGWRVRGNQTLMLQELTRDFNFLVFDFNTPDGNTAHSAQGPWQTGIFRFDVGQDQFAAYRSVTFAALAEKVIDHVPPDGLVLRFVVYGFAVSVAFEFTFEWWAPRCLGAGLA